MTEQLILDAESFFEMLPAEREREYEKKIAIYAENADNPESIRALHEMADGKSKYGFEAFFCLSILYRRKKDFVLLKNLIDEHPQYRKRLSYNHIYIAYLVHSETFFDYDELLLMAYRDSMAFNNNSGFIQAFCNAFVTIVEQCDDEGRQPIVDEWYDSALTSINRAIELDPGYAKYYCTKGRILAQKGRFSEAVELINLAISREKSSRPDYALTLQSYENFKTRIMLRRMNVSYEAKIRELQNQINELKAISGATAGISTDDSIKTNITAKSGEDAKNTVTDKLKGSFAFVSYGHTDSEEVVHLINELQGRGVNIWYDAYITYGSEWPEEIGNHIVNSSMVVVMLSANSMNSANVRREVNLALSEKKPLLILKLDEVNLSPGMRLQFEMYQMIDKSNYQNDNFVTLVENEINRGLAL